MFTNLNYQLSICKIQMNVFQTSLVKKFFAVVFHYRFDRPERLKIDSPVVKRLKIWIQVCIRKISKLGWNKV